MSVNRQITMPNTYNNYYYHWYYQSQLVLHILPTPRKIWKIIIKTEYKI